MRIIAGTARGRRLYSPAKKKRSLIRPTSDRAREALFNIISQRINGALVLDLFAGTGALGLEALSRGAAHCLAIDNSPESLRLIRANSAACSFADKLTLVKRDLRKGLGFLQSMVSDQGFSLVFLDPPYGRKLSLRLLEELADIPPEQIVLLNATGTHRPNTKEELERMLTPEVVARYRIVNHDCRNR